jgi:hypothetical protein
MVALAAGRVGSVWVRHAGPRAGAVKRMRAARMAQAPQFAAKVLPIIRDIQAAGYTSLNALDSSMPGWTHGYPVQGLDAVN